MRRVALALGLAGVLFTIAENASANATLINGLGGPAGYGTSCVPPNDDGSWPAPGAPGLDLTTAFPSGLHFYNGTYLRGWINNNGSLSFTSSISTYTPNAFPGAPQPMIAPYWADVDTRGSMYCNNVGYPSGGGYPTGATCMNPASNGVWWDIKPGQMIVTWDRVGYFLCHTDKLMAFQMILTANNACDPNSDGGVSGTNFDIEFRYNQCGWETGDASGGMMGFGGTPAQAGFDSGDNMHYASLPMSRMAGISTELCTQSNLNPPQSGIWRFAVRGGQIMCPDAGKPCMTGQPGICAQGVLQCNGTSMTTTCVPLTTPQAPKCNGLDNNCDGVVDTTCPTNFVCVGAACVPACVEGGCPAGTTCTATSNGKVCVETACIGVTCPQGKRCAGGQCVDSCSGVTCPIGQICRLGTCVDPCAGLNCGMGQVCENGACVPTCPCRMCDTTKTCITMGTDKGKCIETDCVTKTCNMGEVCQMGNCVDACTGAHCPQGQECKVGKCVDLPPMDAGSDSGIIVPPSDDGGTDDATVGGDGGDDGGPNDFANASQKSGCGCRTAEGGDENALALSIGVGLAAMFIGRRRRSRK